MVIRKENIIMKKFYILISLFTFLLTGCEEDNLHKPYGPDDGIINSGKSRSTVIYPDCRWCHYQLQESGQ